ncbi:hypothetical protein GCM10009678_77690 [Actinomadura kijaniata]|uniref:Uncharacterized protein n=1 Tax=Actinomadura namibiensis TaxID=182080 RepID=A0A7W3LNT5_ACTNM|nr:hypothetical protein [Actinomadura namibiensis]MBA8951497.1 hypothetical protein [Actinomadura namibiensis]
MAVARWALTENDLDTARAGLDDLVDWADRWADHPHRPAEPRPDEADRQIRDYAKDAYPERLSVRQRDRVGRITLFMNVGLRALAGADLPRQVREDVFYLYGRVSMALDAGHLAAAERELARLEELRERYAPRRRGPG